MVIDHKLGKTDNSLLVYVADVINFTDYSPYGTQLDNRHQIQVNTDEYRYGFQDQEADDEIKGEGNSYNYEYRMNDPRLGRFFAVDPLTAKYPWYTPYQFSGNKLIDHVELEGLEEKSVWSENDRLLMKPNWNYGDFFTYLWNQTAGEKTCPTLRNISAGAMQATYDIAESSYHFVTRDAWKGSTWSGFASGVSTLYFMSGGLNGLSSASYYDRAFGTNFYNRTVIGFACLDNFVSGIPNWSSYEWSYNTTTALWTIFGGELLGVSKVRSYAISSSMAMAEKVGIRMSLARDFLKLNGATNLERHMAAIYFEKPVQTITYQPGTKFYRWTNINDPSPNEFFFLDKNTLPGEVGKTSIYQNAGNYVAEEYTLTKPVKVLQTTTNLDGNPGATQVWSPRISGNSTVRQGTIMSEF